MWEGGEGERESEREGESERGHRGSRLSQRLLLIGRDERLVLYVFIITVAS